jgi:protein-ribulosamine 3-kinase
VSLPAGIRSAVEAAIHGVTGRGDPVVKASAVGGGCVSPTARIETAGGAAFFLKWEAPGLPPGMLEAEAAGLRSLAASGAVRVPVVLGSGGSGAGEWLLLEWLEPGLPGSGSWAALGRALATLHREQAPGFGAPSDNFIGPLPQDNRPIDDWPTFWRDRRLAPQLAAATDAGIVPAGDARRFDALFRRLEDLLAPGGQEGPSLLHGDLWRGNVHFLSDGSPALVDPSAYHGHREVDLAMADLFGGFGPGFLPAYAEEWPLVRGYETERRGVYQLYYLLVHVNLFGAGYLPRTLATLAALGV